MSSTSTSSHNAAPESPPLVAIVGSGSIGVAFALLFASAGWSVRMQDPDETRRSAVIPELRDRLAALTEAELCQEPIDSILARVKVTADLAEALAGVSLVQECAPERADLKTRLFAQFEAFAPADALLASSSSALPASAYTSELSTRSRCLVAHPGNPPYLIPVIELVPAPYTAPETIDRAAELYRRAGLKPIRVGREIEGFVFNRLQGAVLREAYCLVRDGIASVEDIDTVVRDGLGQRWSFMGPFETVDLNTRGGIASHAQKMGPAYAVMGAQRGQNDPWTDELVSKVASQRRALLPLDQWEARVNWRDRMLMRLRRMSRPGTSSKG